MGAEHQSIGSGETRSFPNGKVELVTVGGATVGLATFQPGWRWSEHVKPLVGTNSCQVAHTGYCISGQCGIRMDDGTEFIVKSGEAYDIPAGHDGWVVGNEPYVAVDMTMAEYAKPTS